MNILVIGKFSQEQFGYHIAEIRNGILKIINEEDYKNDLIEKVFANADRFTLSKISEEYLM